MQIIYNSIENIDQNLWSSFVPKKRLFLSYAYLKGLEKACPALEFRYLIEYKGEKPIGVAALQLVDFKGRSLFNYLPENNAFLNSIMKWALNKIDVKLISLGNLISSGEKGWYYEMDNDEALNQILKAVNTISDSIKEKVSGVLINKETSIKSKKVFDNHQFHHYRAEDEMHLFLKPEWKSIVDYENAVQSKYKVRLRKVYKVSDDIERKDLSLEFLETNRSEINRLFFGVLDHAKFKMVDINSEYFIAMKSSLIDTFFVHGYFVGEKMVGFISFFENSDELDVHYIGMDYSLSSESKLYNRVLYDMLHIAIEKGDDMICYGRTAHEIKSTLGAVPETIYNFLKINHRFYNALLPFFLKRLVPKDWIQRNPFKSI